MFKRIKAVVSLVSENDKRKQIVKLASQYAVFPLKDTKNESLKLAKNGVF